MASEGLSFQERRFVLRADRQLGLQLEVDGCSLSSSLFVLVPVPVETFVLGIVQVPVFCLHPATGATSAPNVLGQSDIGAQAVYLYEDRWWHNTDFWKDRLRVRFGKASRIFARNCRVIQPEPAVVQEFLAQCHTYGTTKCKHRFALEDHQGRVVAVATFSSPRPMMRGAERVESWEWVRYASLPSLVVVGGMSRLLSAFERAVHPQEVMTYADLEWSAGQAYRNLGFEAVDRREAVSFWVNPDDWSRHSLTKITNDRTYRGTVVDFDRGVTIQNLGSEKFLKRYW